MMKTDSGQKQPSFPSSMTFELMGTRVNNQRVYQLVRFALSRRSLSNRRRIMDWILQCPEAIGVIEWWVKGSITRKPLWEFDCILVFEKTSNSRNEKT